MKPIKIVPKERDLYIVEEISEDVRTLSWYSINCAKVLYLSWQLMKIIRAGAYDEASKHNI